MSDQRSGITQDERRAKTLVIEQLPDADPIELLQKWTKFLAEKVRYDNHRLLLMSSSEDGRNCEDG